MTNEELAELLAKVKYTAEHGVFDAAEKSMLADMEVVGTALQSLIATAREAEALRAENARLRGAISWVEPPFVDANTPENELRSRISFCVADAKRAALEQGEVK